jgi:hypothetical protein
MENFILLIQWLMPVAKFQRGLEAALCLTGISGWNPEIKGQVSPATAFS